MPKSVAICFSDCPGSRLRATRTTSSRNSLGNGFGTVHILPAAPLSATDQMSPIRAADSNPAEAVFRAESEMFLRYAAQLGTTFVTRARTPGAGVKKEPNSFSTERLLP